MGKFLLHGNIEALGPDVQLHPLLHRIQIDNNAALVLHGQTGRASGQGDARPGGRIVAGKLGKITQIVDVAHRADGGNADVAYAKAVNLEEIAFALETSKRRSPN